MKDDCSLHTYQQIFNELGHAPLSVNYTSLLCRNMVKTPEQYILRKIFLERSLKKKMNTSYYCARQQNCAL